MKIAYKVYFYDLEDNIVDSAKIWVNSFDDAIDKAWELLHGNSAVSFHIEKW